MFAAAWAVAKKATRGFGREPLLFSAPPLYLSGTKPDPEGDSVVSDQQWICKVLGVATATAVDEDPLFAAACSNGWEPSMASCTIGVGSAGAV